MKKYLSSSIALIFALLLSFGLSSCDLVIGTISSTGNISGTVRDAVSGTGLSGVTVRLYNSSNIQKDSATTSSSGDYSFTDIAKGTGYYAVFSKTDYLSATYYGIAVNKNETTYLETLLQVNSTYSGIGYATGSLTDAFNGSSLSSVTLDFFAGLNTTSGTLLHTQTSTNGYSVSTSDLGGPGYYTVRATKANYTTALITVVLAAGHTISDQNISMTPDIDSSEYRIILDWGSSPADLDSHLTGPTEGIDRFHIYFSNKSYTPTGSATADVALDLDDTNSYGPETTTIYNKRTGEYRFYVHDYSNRYANSSSPSLALSYSGARVRIYQGTHLAAMYYVPTGYYGNCWEVFRLSGSTLTPVNTVSYIDDWNTGRSAGEGNPFAELPSKK